LFFCVSLREKSARTVAFTHDVSSGPGNQQQSCVVLAIIAVHPPRACCRFLA